MKVEELEKLAVSIGLLIKIQVRETIGLCFFRIVIAEQKDNIITVSYTHLTLPTISSV